MIFGRSVGCRKAGVCPDGLFTDWQRKLVNTDSSGLTCTVCQELLKQHGWCSETAMSYIEGSHSVDIAEEPCDETMEPAEPEEVAEDPPVPVNAHSLAKSYSQYYEARS